MYVGTRTPIVGRASEREAVRRFLSSASTGTHALVLHGEAGVGKTTLWQHAVQEAGRVGYRVATTRPTEAEARLPFAGLNDLFGDLLDDVQPSLPAPQRMGLDVALLRAEAGERGPEPLAISLGLLGLIRAAVERAPLALAVDDVQWLDASTASVLEFVLRRLDGQPVVLLAAARTRRTPSQPDPLPVVGAVPPDRLVSLEVPPLSPRELDRLIASTLGFDLAPSVVRRLHGVSGGNPFYAVELARALQRRGLTSFAGDLPLPDTLSALVRDRLAGLSPAARQVTAYAAALAVPDEATIGAALGEETALAGLREAVAGEVLVTGEHLRFSHPLLAAESYAGIADRDRREMHRRLAAAVGEPEEQARHLAIATEGPDEEVAALLERAADRVNARGAPDDAADLAERAAALTPGDDDARHRRSMTAARYRVLAGEVARARIILEAELGRAPEGNRRAEVLMRLGEVRFTHDDWEAARDLLREALDLVRDDVRLEIQIKLHLVGVSFITGRDWEGAMRHVTEAMELADRLGDPRVIAATIGHYATWRHVTGEPPDPELERRAAELEPYTDHVRTMDHPDYDFSRMRWDEGDVAGYRRLLERLVARAERTADYSSLPWLVGNLVAADVWEGRRDAALERLDQAERVARATGQASSLASVLVWRAYLAARLGDVDDAHRHAEESLEIMAATGWVLGKPRLLVSLAELALSLRDARRADELLRTVIGTDVAPAWNAAAAATLRSEALVGIGRVDEAQALLERYVRLPYDGPEKPAAAEANAAHALVAAAQGDLDRATRLAETAQGIAERFGDRWRLARASLIAADLHRRGRHRAQARAAVLQAIELFEALGARRWAANAREQLDRVAAARDEGLGLTPTQLEVAQLASRGLTNRQVGDRLFMSPHTVEAHLSAVYRTLRITSRGELAGALEERADGPRDSARDLRDSRGTRRPEVEGPAEFR